MQETFTSYRKARQITVEELQKLIDAKYVKFIDEKGDEFLKYFSDCPKPDKGVTKPFEIAFDPEQVYVFKYENLCYFVTPSEYYTFDAEEGTWNLTPTWQYFKSEKFRGCTRGYINNIDKFIYPAGLLAKMSE
jgi:hypothetical protein